MGKFNSVEDRKLNREIERAFGNRYERILKRLAVVLAAASLMLGGTYMFFLLMIHPPDIGHPVVRNSAATVATRADIEALPEGALSRGFGEPLETVQAGWREGVYTILIAGEDDDGGGTDVVMVLLFDTIEGRIDLLSIPRDTKINVPWSPGRLNSVQGMYRRLDGDYDRYVYGLIDEVANLIGYQVNSWVTLDLRGFVALVDAVGGVHFNVPQRMQYADPCQNLFINLHPGYQRLDGNQAMQLVRFRRYSEGDIQRIRVQQDFLAALADQLLQARNLLLVDDLIRIFRDNVETDLSVWNLAFFAQEFLRMDRENIHFHTVDQNIANIFDRVNGASMVTLYLEPWLELINAYMNPFTWEITVDDVAIITREERTRAFVVTDGTFYRTRGD